jgi:hypothetical protein
MLFSNRMVLRSTNCALSAPLKHFTRRFTSELEARVAVETTKDNIAVVNLNRPSKKNALGEVHSNLTEGKIFVKMSR